MSDELKSYLNTGGVPISRTTPYNPSGNGQCERFNPTTWNSVVIACKTRNLDIKRWERVLPNVLHSLRSLLCTAINTTTHERIFTYSCRSAFRESIPSWLSSTCPVLPKRHVQASKYEPLVDEVELIEVNPTYAHIGKHKISEWQRR